MSRLYSNIKCLCTVNKVAMRAIEAPMQAGSISRYENRGKIEDLPVWLVCKAAMAFGVTVEDLMKRDFARELEAEKIKAEMKRLQERLAEIEVE